MPKNAAPNFAYRGARAGAKRRRGPPDGKPLMGVRKIEPNWGDSLPPSGRRVHAANSD